ncbi:Uncharacterized protein dnm_007910 [Desulfonema magnum]|uniref:Uncharacterized protein n=1 Tax=Desulfonema magnum TaxID=45655 RepID=A0A975GKJ8_9BACT|nr:Uncharacterized protein dnm_007910 [Desulfonema magnum]
MSKLADYDKKIFCLCLQLKKTRAGLEIWLCQIRIRDKNDISERLRIFFLKSVYLNLKDCLRRN